MTTRDQADPPRVLFITSEPPHTRAAGAILFYRLFSGYPPDRLLVVTNHLPPLDSSRLSCRYSRLPLIADRLNRTRFWHWRAILRSFGASELTRLSRVDSQLDGFKPDIVVTLMQDSWYYDLAARYAANHKLPLMLFVHDLAHGFESVPSCFQPRQLARDKSVYGQASVRLCISKPMADYFEQLFGITGDVLPPPRSNRTPAQTPENCRTLKTPGRLTLGYAGGLHYGYGEQLLAMIPSLRETTTVVELFGPEPSGQLSMLRQASDIFHFNGFAPNPEEAARGLLTKCDAVLQPYLNPPGLHALQYRTHFPSKLGDYLSLGLPMLVTGPDDAAGTSWCLGHPGSALTLTDPSPPALVTALTQLRENAELRVSLASHAQSFAHEFAVPDLRTKLMTHIYSAAGSASS